MIRSCWAASVETWFGPTLTSKRWEYASMRQNSGRAHLERSWVLSRADLTEPELPRAHGQNSSILSAESIPATRFRLQ